MKILAIGAHPDDIEIFMYGLLRILKTRGDNVFLAIATDGCQGGDLPKKELVKIRKKETISGLSELAKPYFLNLPDGQLGDNLNHKLKIRNLINKIKPDIIITHDKKDYHSDHRILSNFVSEIAGHYIPVIYSETMMGINFTPNYYIDITDVFDIKKKAVMCHLSQKPDRFVNLIKIMNGYRSAQCNAPIGNYAECYSFERSFPFSDITKILPSPPKIRPFYIKNQLGFL